MSNKHFNKLYEAGERIGFAKGGQVKKPLGAQVTKKELETIKKRSKKPGAKAKLKDRYDRERKAYENMKKISGAQVSEKEAKNRKSIKKAKGGWIPVKDRKDWTPVKDRDHDYALNGKHTSQVEQQLARLSPSRRKEVEKELGPQVTEKELERLMRRRQKIRTSKRVGGPVSAKRGGSVPTHNSKPQIGK